MKCDEDVFVVEYYGRESRKDLASRQSLVSVGSQSRIHAKQMESAECCSTQTDNKQPARMEMELTEQRAT